MFNPTATNRVLKEPPRNKRMKFSKEAVTYKPNEGFNQYEGKITDLCEGYLYIQSKSLWRFPNHLWKLRYFTLRGDVLYFTKNKGDLIFTDSTPSIEIESDTGIYPEENPKGQKKFFIRICKGKQTYVLCSENENDRNTWLACLLTVITQKYVVNFKSGFYKSVRLNYKPKPDRHSRQRHSSFVPKRIADEEIKRQFERTDDKGSLILSRAESLFEISPTNFNDRKSFVAFAE